MITGADKIDLAIVQVDAPIAESAKKFPNAFPFIALDSLDLVVDSDKKKGVLPFCDFSSIGCSRSR